MNLEKEQEIFTKVKNYLGAKELFLNTRQITIDSLRKICNELEISLNIGKHAKTEEKGKLISAGGNAFSSLTFGIIKAFGEAIQSINNSSKRKLSTKLSAEFQRHLIADEESLKLFAKDYFSLIDAIKENKELTISSDIIKALNLENRLESKNIELFTSDYETFKVVKNI